MAEALPDGPAKAHLMEMARAWHSLADQAERNSKADLVYEPAPVRADRQPVMQQQQQIQRPKHENEG
jgi:hypothetical protein